MQIASMKIACLSGIAVMAVAGCGGADVTMQPGRYEMTATVTDINMPGAPEGIADAMKEAAKQTQSACLSAEDVKDPGTKLAPRDNPGNACSENRFDWKGGKIDGKMRCSIQGQGEVTADMSGSYTADTFNFEVKTELPNMAGQGERGRLTLRSEGRRVGECNGSEGPTK